MPEAGHLQAPGEVTTAGNQVVSAGTSDLVVEGYVAAVSSPTVVATSDAVKLHTQQTYKAIQDSGAIVVDGRTLEPGSDGTIAHSHTMQGNPSALSFDDQVIPPSTLSAALSGLKYRPQDLDTAIAYSTETMGTEKPGKATERPR